MKLSVVIPTLNEEDYLLEALLTIKENATYSVEILIVDAGSQDETLQQIIDITNERFHVDEELRGRKYESLNTGAHLTSGDIILFLDADTLLPVAFDKHIERTIEQGAVGGAFSMKFDKTPFPMRFIQFINHLRYSLSKQFFGDQAVFCTRDAFERVGGYPEILVMESAHLCKRLKKIGKLKLIKKPVISSSRRFVEGGILKVFFNDLNIYLKDFFGKSIEMEAREYWKLNAKVSSSQADKS